MKFAQQDTPSTPPSPAGPAGQPDATADPNVEAAKKVIEDVSSGLGPVLEFFRDTYQSVFQQLFSWDGAIQLGVIALAGVLALVLTRPGRVLLARVWPDIEGRRGARARALVERLMFPILWVLGLWLGSSVLSNLNVGNDLLRIAASLLNAWIVIRLVTSFIADPFIANAVAVFAWMVAALNILRLLEPMISLLDSAAINFGDARLSIYSVLKGGLLATLFVWGAMLVARLIQARVDRTPAFTPSVRTLIGQAARLTLLFFAIMMALGAVGIDLTALAVFSGALGVGIGFGLQSIFSNLMAGIIMLLERSVKVGDFVDLESGLTGEVREINIRSTRVTTNDNVDILVPNSEFINQRVTNWTLREAHRRIRIPFGVAYGTDKDLVRKAVLEAAEKVPHMLEGPGARDPQVWLAGFGDSSLDFELVVWLKPEAVKRPAAVQADYNWEIETALGKYGIEIPFPQRDLHIRSGKLPVLMSGNGEAVNLDAGSADAAKAKS